MDDLNKIFEALSHELRRKIITLLAKKGPLLYSQLMNELKVEDSGLLAFHLRKLKGLVTKNEKGQYILTDLGLKAYSILQKLGGEEEGEKGYKEVIEEKQRLEPVVIRDRARYILTENIARSYLKRGQKLVFEKILKLTIEKMPRELLDSVLESINDCLVVQVPSGLEDIVTLKSNKIFDIRVYDKEKHIVSIPTRGLVESIIESIIPSVNAIIDSVLIELPRMIKMKQRLYPKREEEIVFPQGSQLEIYVDGGILRISEGEKAKIRIWGVNETNEGVNIDVKEDEKRVVIEIDGGNAELTIPKNSIDILKAEIDGGYSYITLTQLSELNLTIDGGVLDLTTKTDRPLVSDIELNGGGLKLGVILEHKDTASFNVQNDGGYLIGDIHISPETKTLINVTRSIDEVFIYKDDNLIKDSYKDENYDTASSKLIINMAIDGGFTRINIKSK